ncbi:MAG: DHA2 family efflux MFS transporter permease subunit [Syntrophorhabdales bacterium]|jgi:EmrB/QacA subfamily drug resistance transporter
MRRYLIFVTAGLGLLMYSIDTTVVAVAFPRFMKEFHATVLWAGWTISIYYIAVTMAMPLVGSLGDRLGRKRVFLVSLGLFTVGSLFCALAPSILFLIAFRFIQGIGGAAFLPTASGIVSEAFPENRESAIGLFTSIFTVGAIIGPNLGGWIVSAYSWRYIFYINLPIGIVLIVLIMILIEDPRSFSRPRIDLAGAAFMSGGILLLMAGLNLIGETFSGGSLLLGGFFLVLGLLSVLLFLRHERGEENPILDVALLRSTPFLAANLVNMFMGAGIFAVYAFVPLYATSVRKMSTLMSGMILTPRSLGTIPASAITAFTLRRWGYRRPIIVGLVIVSLAVILLGEDRLWGVAGARFGVMGTMSFLMLLSGIGMGIMFPATNNACIELMPDRVATIVGLRGTFRTIGGAFGISLITIILHLSANPARGFRIAFLAFGLELLFVIPLVFLMPQGRRSRG